MSITVVFDKAAYICDGSKVGYPVIVRENAYPGSITNVCRQGLGLVTDTPEFSLQHGNPVTVQFLQHAVDSEAMTFCGIRLTEAYSITSNAHKTIQHAAQHDLFDCIEGEQRVMCSLEPGIVIEGTVYWLEKEPKPANGFIYVRTEKIFDNGRLVQKINPTEAPTIKLDIEKIIAFSLTVKTATQSPPTAELAA